MKIHELKTVQPYFGLVKNGLKSFELRKNDRDFRSQDYVILKEYDENKGFTGEKVFCQICFIMFAYPGIESGYCVFSFARVNETDIPAGPKFEPRKPKMK